MTEEYLKLTGAIFLFMGVLDVVLAQSLFKKKEDAAFAAAPLNLPPKEREVYLQKARGIQLVKKIIQGTGMLFVLTGLYLLIR